MCTAKEVQDIVSLTETRLEKQIESLETHQNKRLEDSHMVLSRSISNFGADIKSLEVKIKEFLSLSISPMIEDSVSIKKRIEKNENSIEELYKIHNELSEKVSTGISTINTKINTALRVFGITIPIILTLGGWIFLNELTLITESIKETREAVEETKKNIPNEVSKILDTKEFTITEE